MESVGEESSFGALPRLLTSLLPTSPCIVARLHAAYVLSVCKHSPWRDYAVRDQDCQVGSGRETWSSGIACAWGLRRISTRRAHSANQLRLRRSLGLVAAESDPTTIPHANQTWTGLQCWKGAVGMILGTIMALSDYQKQW